MHVYRIYQERCLYEDFVALGASTRPFLFAAKICLWDGKVHKM